LLEVIKAPAHQEQKDERQELLMLKARRKLLDKRKAISTDMTARYSSILETFKTKF